MRDRLANNRNGFFAVANVFVLALALLVFWAVPNSIDQFRILCITCLSVGLAASLFYMIQIREVSLEMQALDCDKAYKKQLMKESGLANNESEDIDQLSES